MVGASERARLGSERRRRLPRCSKRTCSGASGSPLRRRGRVVTPGDDKPNRIREITPDGVWVETERSRAAGRPPQLVEAWRVQVAWDWLQAHGSLTNRHLVATDGLNVKRSSFVCALLAVFPEAQVRSRRPIELVLLRKRPPAPRSLSPKARDSARPGAARNRPPRVVPPA